MSKNVDFDPAMYEDRSEDGKDTTKPAGRGDSDTSKPAGRDDTDTSKPAGRLDRPAED